MREDCNETGAKGGILSQLGLCRLQCGSIYNSLIINVTFSPIRVQI